MPQPTFADLWMRVRLYVPNAPVFLVQDWCKNAMRELAGRRQWSWQMLQGQLTWQDAREVTNVTAQWGSSTITKVGAFSSADVGRNFRVGTYPIYTILDADADTLTLDRDYEGLTEGTLDQDAQILDAYCTMPSNFENFIMVLDPVNQRMIPWWATWDEMNSIDPIRQAAESVPRLLCAASPSVLPATLGYPQYEYYPKPTVHNTLQYYAKSFPAMNDADPIPGMLATRQDVLLAHILGAAARWPGTADQKNPYFNLQLAAFQGNEFERLANQLDIRDDDVYQQSWDRIPWQRWSAWSWAYDTHLLQQTDATLSSYAGYGYY